MPESPAVEDPGTQTRAGLRRVAGMNGQNGRALVALPDGAQVDAVSATLGRLGWTVDTLSDWEEGTRLLEQGVFGFVVTARGAMSPKGESLHNRIITRLSADHRRRIFLALVGDEFRTGDGTQAFVALADMVLHPGEIHTADRVIRQALDERNRLYRVFRDAQQRFESGD